MVWHGNIVFDIIEYANMKIATNCEFYYNLRPMLFKLLCVPFGVVDI